MTDIYDTLPPTQQLILDVLAARYRLGETLWTFSTRVRPALAQLEHLGLINTMHGIVYQTLRARLTNDGRELVLSPTYVAPLFSNNGAFNDSTEGVPMPKYQLCPKCKGTGVMSRPPGVPSDVSSWNSSTTGPYTCNLCEGKMYLDTEPPRTRA